MRNILAAIFLLLALNLFAANPTFSTFSTNDFNVNQSANSISLKNPGGGSSTNIIDPTDLVITVLYTNTSGSNLLVTAGLILKNTQRGTNQVFLEVDNNNDGTFETKIPVTLGSDMLITNQITGSVTAGVSPGGVYQIVPGLSLGGGSINVVSGSCQRIYSSTSGGGGGGGGSIGGAIGTNGVAITQSGTNAFI